MKHRTLAIILALCLLLTLLPTAAFAAEGGSCGDDVHWSLSGGTLTIRGTGPMYDYADQLTPWQNLNVTSAVIEEGVTYLGAYAFTDCKKLTAVRLPASLTELTVMAFEDCPSLKSITVDAKNDSFSSANGILYNKYKTLLIRCPEAFSGSCTVPGTVVNIYDEAFLSCKKLTSVKLPDPLQYIGDFAFMYCSGLGDVTIPKEVHYIGEAAFGACDKMKHIWVNADNFFYASTKDGVLYSKLYGNIVAIPSGRTGKFVVPSTATQIDYYAGFGSHITGLEIGPQVKEIETCAFAGCKGLTTLTLPSSIVIRDGAFMGCSELTKVKLGDHANIGEGAFALCGKLKDITFGAWSDLDDQAFYGCTALETVIIPSHVLLGENVFEECSALRNVVLLGGGSAETNSWRETIGTPKATVYYTAATANSWQYMKPDGMHVIPLTERPPFYDVHDGKFYDEAVSWAVQNNITAGKTDYYFAPGDPCTRAQVVAFLWRACGAPAPKSSKNPFVDVSTGKYYTDAVLWAVENGITKGTDRTHFSPDAKVSRAQFITFLYRAKNSPAAAIENPFNDVADGQYYTDAVLWAVENGVTTGESLTVFGVNKACNRGQVVTFLYRACGSDLIPEGLVDYGTFGSMKWTLDTQGTLTVTGTGEMPEYLPALRPWQHRLDQIRSVVIGDGITYINTNTFSGCPALTSVTLPDSLQFIGDNAFSDCTGLTEIVLPDSVLEVGTRAFSGCTGLTRVVMPGVHWIDPYAFADCTSLTDIRLPDTLECLNEGAFSGCSSLETVTIPQSVPEILRNTFKDCSSLTTVTFEGFTKIRGPHYNPYVGCTSLTRLVLPEGHTLATDEHGVLYLTDIEGHTSLYLMPGGFSGSYTVPEGVQEIGAFACQGCTKLTQVDLGSVETVSQYAFEGCTGLTEITVPATTDYFGGGAFSGCTALRKATFQGDAPYNHGYADSIFEDVTADFVIYYPADAQGWTTPTWNGWHTQPIE